MAYTFLLTNAIPWLIQLLKCLTLCKWVGLFKIVSLEKFFSNFSLVMSLKLILCSLKVVMCSLFCTYRVSTARPFKY